MIKDTNPDHYKVEGANFIEYMNDPKISGFGNWMFANGFNSGVWASTNWISVKDRLPETPDGYPHSEIRRSYFLVALKSGCVESLGFDFDRMEWQRTGSPVTHWMPLPEPPEEVKQAK